MRSRFAAITYDSSCLLLRQRRQLPPPDASTFSTAIIIIIVIFIIIIIIIIVRGLFPLGFTGQRGHHRSSPPGTIPRNVGSCAVRSDDDSRDISGRDNRWSALFRTRAGPGKRTSPRLPSRFLATIAKIAVCRRENDPWDPPFDPWNRVTEGAEPTAEYDSAEMETCFRQHRDFGFAFATRSGRQFFLGIFK